MADEQQVEIEVRDRFAWVRPPHESLLAPLLTYSITRFQTGGPFGHHRGRERKQCYKVDDGRLLIPAALVPEASAILRSAGLAVRVTHTARFESQLPIDPKFVAQVHGRQRQLLDAVYDHCRGLIQVRRPRDVVPAVADICRLYPTARIMIPVATRGQVQRLRRQLPEALGSEAKDKVRTPKTWRWGEGDRLLVCTLELFDAANPDDWDIILLPVATHALSSRHLHGLTMLARRRIYGFRDAQTPINRRTHLRLSWMIGGIIHQAADEDGYPAEVQVQWLTPPWSRPLAEMDALERKKVGYWHNDARNDHIASVITALAERRTAKLWEYGLLLNDKSNTECYKNGAASVTVIVESTEHGAELLRRLPGWQMMSASSLTSLSVAPPILKSPFPNLYHQVIVTAVAASQLPKIDTDILLRADGSEWPWKLAGFPPTSSEQGRQVLLLDLADDFDDRAKDASRRRQQHYDSRGWRMSTAPSWLLAGHGADDDPD